MSLSESLPKTLRLRVSVRKRSKKALEDEPRTADFLLLITGREQDILEKLGQLGFCELEFIFQEL
jgi:hypothetical protein